MTTIDELIKRLQCLPCQSASDSKLILDAIDILADYDKLVVANEMLENMLEVARSKSQVRHGEWLERTRETLIPVEYDSNGDPILHKVTEYRCSLCNRLEGKKEPYCNCGAKMGETAPALPSTIIMEGPNKFQKVCYEPTCRYGYVDCICDPAYIQATYPEWHARLLAQGALFCETCEDGSDYDDEDK